jgi:hypothetical protein
LVIAICIQLFLLPCKLLLEIYLLLYHLIHLHFSFLTIMLIFLVVNLFHLHSTTVFSFFYKAYWFSETCLFVRIK